MKKRQIHLSLTEDLYQLLKDQSAQYGLPLTHFVKYMLVKELHAHPINLNIRKQSEKYRMNDEVEDFRRKRNQFDE